jgi:hypothetical protein
MLHHIHEYGTPTETMTLLKSIQDETMLIPYEQLFIRAFHQNGNLVPEQHSNETNPLLLAGHTPDATTTVKTH